MSILDAYIPFVKDHAAFHDRRAQEFQTSSPTRAKRHRATADTLTKLISDIVKVSATLEATQQRQQQSEPASQPAAGTPAAAAPSPDKNLKLALTEEDIAGLPSELLNELSLSSADRAEFAILSILEESGGVSSLDRLLIGLYRKTGEIHKRDKLVSRLYRMVQKNLIYNFPGKKGVYTSDPPAGYEAQEQESGGQSSFG